MYKKLLLYCYHPLLKLWLTSIVILLIGMPVLVLAQNEAGASERTYYQGIKVDQSYSGNVYLEPGKGMTFWVKYKNVGYYRWREAGPRTVYLKLNDETEISKKFYHQFWRDKETVAVLPQRTEVGEYVTFRFALQAPGEPGEYLVKLRPWAYGDWVDGEDIQILIRVGWAEYLKKLEAEQGVRALGVDSEASYIVTDLQFPEPNIRVGLYSLDREKGDRVQILSNGAYRVYDIEGNVLLTQTQGETTEVQFDFENKRYFINIGGRRLVTSDGYYSFKQNEADNIFTIANYSNPAYGGSEVNYNQYRGSLEAQWVEDNGRLWVINELKMEDYLKGSGEAMDVSPIEFLKAMAVAERTYAMFHYINPTKHSIRNFTVTASQSDQIYQGYAREIRQPNIVKAVEETGGLIATYKNEVALTPYFSQSDGRTRSYEEVWHRTTYPYLVSVVDPHMEGKQMIGHGVGMSARGALFKASRDGDSFSDLLKHYYTGVEVNKAY